MSQLLPVRGGCGEDEGELMGRPLAHEVHTRLQDHLPGCFREVVGRRREVWLAMLEARSQH